MEYYLAIKKNTFESVLMRWIKLEPIIQSEVSQKEKHRLPLKHRYREQTCDRQEGGWIGAGMAWELEISRCKLLYSEWISSKILLLIYSTRKYI